MPGRTCAGDPVRANTSKRTCPGEPVRGRTRIARTHARANAYGEPIRIKPSARTRLGERVPERTCPGEPMRPTHPGETVRPNTYPGEPVSFGGRRGGAHKGHGPTLSDTILLIYRASWILAESTWCSGITPAQHAGGPRFNPQRIQCTIGAGEDASQAI